MGWNNRIIRHEIDGEERLALHEVYYNEDGSIKAWTKKPVTEFFEDTEDIVSDLEQKLRDAKRFRDEILDLKALEAQIK